MLKYFFSKFGTVLGEYTTMEISLYYSKEKDCLYTATFTSDDALFTSYEEKGFKYNKPKFIGPAMNFGINIQTNFGYGNASYLRAFMQYNGRPLVSCYNWCDSYNCALPHFEVEPNPQYWKYLFDRIISTYKERDSWNYNCIIKIVDQLNNMLSHPDKVCIRNHCWSTKLTTWEGNTSVLHLTKKVSELIRILEFLKIDEYIHIKEGVISICRKTLPIIDLTYRSLVQEEREHGKTIRQTYILQGLKGLEKCYDTIYNYLKRTKQIEILFETKNVFCSNT